MKNLIAIVLFSSLSLQSFANDDNKHNISVESNQSGMDDRHDTSLGYNDAQDSRVLGPGVEGDVLRRAIELVVYGEGGSAQYLQDATQYILGLWSQQNDGDFASRALTVFDHLDQATTAGEITHDFNWMIFLVRVALSQQLEAVFNQTLAQFHTTGFQLNYPIQQHIYNEFIRDVLAGRVRLNQPNLQAQFRNYHREAFIAHTILPSANQGIEYLRRTGLSISDDQASGMRTRYINDYLAGNIRIPHNAIYLEQIFNHYHRDLQRVRSPVMWNETEEEREPSPIEFSGLLPSPRQS